MTTEARRARRLAFRTALVSAVALPAALFVGAQPTGAASSNSFTVKASEYLYKLSGKLKAGWSRITLDNVGTEYHMMAVFPLKPGVTKQQLQTAATSGDEGAFEELGGEGDVFGTPPFLSPGEQTTVVTKLAAGHYGMLCFVPAPDGQDHASHGMVTVFDVSKQKSSFKPPKDGVVNVSISDQAVILPSRGLPAHGWVKVTNTSSSTRDLTLARYAKGATFEQANAYYNELFTSGQVPAGEAPAALVAGVASIPSNGVGYVELDLKKGNYAAVSGNDEEGTETPLHVDFTVT